jgi:hypothetical protein
LDAGIGASKRAIKLRLKANTFKALKQGRAHVEQLLAQYGDAFVRSE